MVKASLVYTSASGALKITVCYLLVLCQIFFALCLLATYQLLLDLEAIHGYLSIIFVSLTDNLLWQAFTLVVPLYILAKVITFANKNGGTIIYNLVRYFPCM